MLVVKDEKFIYYTYINIYKMFCQNWRIYDKLIINVIIALLNKFVHNENVVS